MPEKPRKRLVVKKRLGERLVAKPVLTGKVGRPTLYTAKLAEQIAMFYATGVGLKDAADAAGVGYQTVKDWLRQSEENPTGPKGKFRPMMTEALAASIVVAAQRVNKMDPKWWLSKMRKARWGDQPMKVEVDEKSDLTVTFRHSQFETQLRRIAGLKPRELESHETLDEEPKDQEPVK